MQQCGSCSQIYYSHIHRQVFAGLNHSLSYFLINYAQLAIILLNGRLVI